MRTLNTTSATVGLNIIMLAAVFLALTTGTVPTATAQRSAVRPLGPLEQRRDMIVQLQALNAGLDASLVLKRKLAERDAQWQEQQNMLLQRLERALVQLHAGDSAQHDERLSELRRLNGSAELALVALETLGDQYSKTQGEDLQRSLKRDKDLTTLLQSGRVTVTVSDTVKE